MDNHDALKPINILIKTIDDDRQANKYTTISNFLNENTERDREKIVELCRQIIFNNGHQLGKKSREILWRRGFYQFISFAKKYSRSSSSSESSDVAQNDEETLRAFLKNGILNYKDLARKMEEIYDLDLKLLIDFTILTIDEEDLPVFKDENVHLISAGGEKSLDIISFALETIHSSFLSLGDLHRYMIEYKLNSKELTKFVAAKYYYEAFKLNPSIGMAQNQLGTLFYGQSYDLDSIYHYLYSLVCTIPFELSETNVCRLFTKHTDYLEKIDPDKIDFAMEDFFARFYLIIDILFFDKDVPEFNQLCHCALVDLRKVLSSKLVHKIGTEGIFKIVSILFFCMSKLKMINSPKIYSLNAFVVAVISDLVDACIVNLEQEILIKSKQNLEFQENYSAKFKEFESEVRKTREIYKNWVGTNSGSDKIVTVKKKLSDESSSGVADNGGKVLEKGDKKSQGGQFSMKSSDEAKESDLKTPLFSKNKKKGGMMKLRRRRKKMTAEQSDEESSCYDTDSELDTDFSTDEDDYTDLSSNFESDFSDIDDEAHIQHSDEENKPPKKATSSDDEINKKYPTFSDNEDIVIEEEEIIYPNSGNNQTSAEEIDTDELVKGFEILNMNSDNLKFRSSHSISEDDLNVRKQSIPISEPIKMKYKNMYSKIDPNIVIDFMQNEPTAKALKILFDWLKVNTEILLGCYHSNPEFIHKIIKLLNFCNIDIFTQKNFFNLEFIKTDNVRKNLCDLFNIRCTLPVPEDYDFKSFDLFQASQINLDWEAKIREKITPNEEALLRLFKMIDFGFFICKKKKFNYNFCAKTRKFVEKTNSKKKRERERENDKKQFNNQVTSSRRREKRSAKNSRRRVEGRTRRYSDRKNGIIRNSKCYTSNEEKDTVEEDKSISIPKKCYLRNRNENVMNPQTLHQSSSGADEERSETIMKNDENRNLLNNKKCELMGKLWLQNEVENLENEVSHSGLVK
ncbi:SMG5 family protein [Megaselia abdita]